MDGTNKKKAITEAFLQLVEKKPVDKITVKMVIEKCHLSRSTFYYHFRSITELVEYIILETIDKAYRKSLKAKDLKEMILFLLEPFEENNVLLKKLGMSLQSTEYWSYIVQRVTELIGTIWAESPEKRLNTKDEQFISSVFTFGILGYLLYSIINNKTIQVESLVERVVHFHKMYKEK